MAKKSASTKSKSSKKAVVKAASKAAPKKEAKPAKKAVVSLQKKTSNAKPSSAKPVAKAGQTKNVEKKSGQTQEAVKPKNAFSTKSQANEKPSLMTKKGKTIVEEVESMNVEANADTESPAKAEKISKFKPIRVERGNLSDEKAKWAEVFRKYGKEKSAVYKMSDTFAAMTPLQHKVLGWGFVLTNENDRLEVLFETGIRMLISNYKSS